MEDRGWIRYLTWLVAPFLPFSLGLAILFAIIVVCLSFNSNYLGKKPIDQSR